MFKYQTRIYFHGLVAAIIGGASNAITIMLVDPSNFNLFEGWRKLLMFTIVSAVISAATYLKAHPLPDIDKDIDAVSASRDKINELREGTGDDK